MEKKSEFAWPKNVRVYFDRLRHEIMRAKPEMNVEGYSKELGKLSVYPYISGAVKKGKGLLARLFGRKLVEFEQTRGEEGEIIIHDKSIGRIVNRFVRENDPRNYGFNLELKMAA